MTDESADGGQNTVELPTLDRPLTELTVDELVALKDAYAARGIRIYNSVPWEVVAPLGAVAIYSKTFLETLAKQNAEALLNAVHARVRKKRETIAFLVRADSDALPKFVVAGDLSDEPGWRCLTWTSMPKRYAARSCAGTRQPGSGVLPRPLAGLDEATPTD